eukprot:MONOS_11218.1-p1 / transcript=MONOS_11218.1 / gene=MONOS_11218 / organism=Monocercomonoides_exilis_PA203 / gene_product=unspecified product / transcript_product=unspecified product / location=Mono_scaffold00551:28960-37545(+) / protein_length=2862 / sequence_SO=supercontig / SO=protein_coding / is_pseudo=false
MNATLIVDNIEISSPSLVGSPKEHEFRYSKRTSSSGMLIVEHSMFLSISVSSPPFLSSPSLAEVNVGNSIFCNISFCKHHILPSAYRFHRLQTRGNSCSFVSVHDAFDGGVFESVNAPGASFQSFNNSFMNCAKTSFSGNNNMERKTFDGGSHSFSNCEWHNVSSALNSESSEDWDLSVCGGAIGIHGNSETVVVIDSCIFDNCTCCRYGGAVMVYPGKSVLINNSMGINCTGYLGSFAMLCILIQVEMKYSYLIDCSSSQDGAMRIQEYNFGQSDEMNEIPVIRNCEFTSEKSSARNGCFILLHNSIHSSSIHECMFFNGTSSEAGGALTIYWRDAYGTISEKPWLYFCFFHNNTAGNGNGDDVSILDSFSYVPETTALSVSSFTTKTSGSSVLHSRFGTKNEWLSVGILRRYVDVEGREEVGCGIYEWDGCKTVEYAVDQAGSVGEQRLQLVECTFRIARTVEVGGKTIVMNGLGCSGTIVKSELMGGSSAMVRIGDGALSAASMKILHTSRVSPSPRLFEMTSASGTLSLCCITISSQDVGTADLVVSTSPFLIYLSQMRMESTRVENMALSAEVFSEKEPSDTGASSLANATLENITRTDGDGAVLSVSVGRGREVGVENTTLKNCVCTGGNGGGVFVSLESGGHVRIGGNSEVGFDGCCVPLEEAAKRKGGGVYLLCSGSDWEFSVKKCTFKECKAWKGRNMFVAAPDLSTAVNSGSIGFNLETGVNRADFDELSGMESSNAGLIVPLVLFLREFQPPAYVGGKTVGMDFRLCGFADYMCKTIGSAGTYRFPNSKRILRLAETFVFDEETMLDKGPYEVDASSKSKGVKVEAAGPKVQDALVMSSVTATFTNISFELGASIGGSSTFAYSSAGDVKFIDCAIEGARGGSGVEYGFVSVSGGSVQMLRVSCGGEREVTFGSFVVLVNESGTCAIDQMTMNQMRVSEGRSGSQGIIELATSSPTTIHNSTFANAVLGSGGLIHFAEGSSLKMENTSFTSIGRSGGDGACLELDEACGRKQSVWIENCSFSACKVDGDGSCGGGVYAMLDVPCELHVSSTQFEGCQAPSEGGTNGKGGGLLLNVLDAAVLFDLSATLAFEANQAEYGADLFVVSPDLKASVIKEHILFAIPLTGSTRAAMGVDSKWSDLMIPLMYYLCDDLPCVHMGNDGHDVVVCGHEQFRCKCVDYAVRSVIGKQHALAFGDSYLFEKSVSLSASKGYDFCGAASKTRMEMVGNESSGTCMIGIGSYVRFYQFLCVLPAALPLAQSSIFLVSGDRSELWIEDCSAVCGSSAGRCKCSFVSQSSGYLSITGFSIESVEFEGISFISSNGNVASILDSINMNNVRITDAYGLVVYTSEGPFTAVNMSVKHCSNSGGGVAWDREGGLLEMKNSTFEGIMQADGNGSVVNGVVGSGKEMRMSDVWIEGCGTAKGCGGGMNVVVGGTGKVRIGGGDDVTFVGGCRAGGEGRVGGYGGGLLLRCEEGGGDFGIIDVTFGVDGSANDAMNGGSNVMAECKNLSEVVSEVSFNFSFVKDVGDNPNLSELMGIENGRVSEVIPIVPFFREKPSVGYVYGENGGMDYPSCGYSDFPCSSVPYAGAAVFGARAPAVLRLMSTFTIHKEMTLDAQPMVIDGEVEMERIVVREESDGEEGEVGGGAKECFVETKEKITFHSLMFCAWSFEGSARTCLFMCSDGVLRFEGCSFCTEAGALYMCVECLKGKGGKMELVKCRFEEVTMRGCGLIVADGSEVEVEFEEVTIRNTGREDEGSVLEMRRGNAVSIRNTTIKETNFGNGNEIGVLEEMGLEMRNGTLCEVRRYEGNGGVMSGKVGSGRAWEIENCVFERCESEADYTFGGGIMVSVGDGGKFVFEHNKVDRCGVPSDSGKGGGVHVVFETTKIEYSMKMNEFTNNVAEKGEDVFLVCDSPWLVILPALWHGSATNETAQKKMWVEELTEAGKEDSIINYLFPSLSSYMFVSGTGNARENCGLRENPCVSVDVGFERLKDVHVIMELEGAASVGRVINREGKSLTIQGNGEKQDMSVEESGKFELVKGEALTYMTFSFLQFVLPDAYSGASEEQSVVEVGVGQCSFADCVFVCTESGANSCGRWIVIGKGGVVRMDRTEISGVEFVGGGVVACRGCGVTFENSSINSVDTDGKGMIDGRAGSDIVLKNTTARGCRTNAGALITSKEGSRLRICEHCVFEEIRTQSSRGGCVESEMEGEEAFSVELSWMTKCETEKESGRGGGIFMGLGDGCAENYLLSGTKFKGNEAHEGNDLFIMCQVLNESVSAARLAFECDGDDEVGVDMKGVDREYFGECVDLRLFVVERKAGEVHVSAEGYDTAGCGSEAYPCSTIWSGIGHVDGSGIAGEGRLWVKDKGEIMDFFAFSSALRIEGLGKEGDEIQQKVIRFAETIRGSVDMSVLTSDSSLMLQSLRMETPSAFEPSVKSVVASSGILQLNNCTFAMESGAVVEFSLIVTTNGTCSMRGCTLQDCMFGVTPFLISSSVLLESNNFLHIKNTAGAEGGVAKVELSERDEFVIRSTNASFCSIDAERGKGGFLYVNSQKCTSENGLVFESDVVFGGNVAWMGKNAFILAADLNSTVRGETFRFDYSTMKDDSTLFVGSDGVHTNIDLFVFLVPYTSSEVYVSSEGFDVTRCGSKKEPCRTLWKGIRQVKESEGAKALRISGSTPIRDAFDGSRYEIENAEAGGEASGKAVLRLEKAYEGPLEYFICNSVSLSLREIKVLMTAGFESTAKAVISNKGGELWIKECAFHSEAQLNNGFECVFVDVNAGVLGVDGLSMDSSCTGQSVLRVEEVGVECNLSNMHISSLNETGGCVISVGECCAQHSTNDGKAANSMDMEN